jgi:hypothetical protein
MSLDYLKEVKAIAAKYKIPLHLGLKIFVKKNKYRNNFFLAFKLDFILF